MEPRRSTRARAREEPAPAPAPASAPAPVPKPSHDAPPGKPTPKSLKRKRTTGAAKDATPGPPTAAAEAPRQPLKPTLPAKVAEGQPLPTLADPQPVDLPSHEYQSVQQSGVLSASLQRSRAVWASGSNFRLFHAFFTPPKKVADRTEEDRQLMQRQKEIVKNFPQLGGTIEAQLVIEPHTFPIRLYGPKEMARAAPKKPPQYGQWPNHNHYAPYQQQQQQQQQYNTSPTPFSKPVTPQQRPAQSNPQQKPPTPAPGATTTPAPDPVIHMLAQRAGSDPELKAVMKIVAAGQATSQQLEYFQGHINELTNMMAKQKDVAAKAAPQQHPPPPTAPPAVSAPPPPRPNPQPPPPVIHQQPPPQQHPPKPYQPPTNYSTPQHVAPGPAQPPMPYNQYVNTYGRPQQFGNQYGHPSQPPRTGYRPLVFDFVEGNGDKFYFPSYSFMEWLPNNHGAKFSFLITKMKPKARAEIKATAPPTPASKIERTPTPSQTLVAPPNAPAADSGNETANISAPPSTPAPLQPPAVKPAPTPVQYIPPPRIEDFDEKNDIKDIDFYQPVTVIVLSTDMDVLQSLPRAIRPHDAVEKYMNEIFDTCKRADETHLAFRLPKDGTVDAESGSRRISLDVTPAKSTPITDVATGGIGSVPGKKKGGVRPKKSLVA